MFTISPERLRTIVDRFVETLEKGLEKEGQTVVSRQSILPFSPRISDQIAELSRNRSLRKQSF